MFECVDSFVIDVVDGDGFMFEEGGFIVEKGSIWEVNEEAINVTGADIHIENESGWIELSREMLSQFFRKL